MSIIIVVTVRLYSADSVDAFWRFSDCSCEKRGKINKRAKRISVCVRRSQCVGHNMRRGGAEGSSLSSDTSLLWELTNSWNSLVKVQRLKFFGVCYFPRPGGSLVGVFCYDVASRKKNRKS